MSTDYFAVCYTCKTKLGNPVASGSGFYGFKVWTDSGFAEWLGHGMAVGTHEGHDIRIVSEQVDLEWEYDDEGNWSPSDTYPPKTPERDGDGGRG